MRSAKSDDAAPGSAVFATRTARLEAYEQQTSAPMVVLALLYLLIFAADVLIVPMKPAASTILFVVGNLIWLTFVLDLVLRTILAPRKLDYLIRHPIDVIAVVVPAFRALRVLRVITAGQWLVQRGARLAIGRTALAIVTAVTLLAIIGGLSVYDAERGAPDANITNFGDGLWWAVTTMSTVGYGDTYPTTMQGQMVAVAMMVVGVSLLGVVSATLAAGFLARVQGAQESDLQKVLAKLSALEAQVASMNVMIEREVRRPSEPREFE